MRTLFGLLFLFAFATADPARTNSESTGSSGPDMQTHADSVAPELAEATRLFAAEQYAECSEELNRLLSSNPAEPLSHDARLLRARCLSALNQCDPLISAVDDFEARYSDAPETGELEMAVARALNQAKKKYPDTERRLAAFIAAHPNDARIPEAQFRYGAYLNTQHRYAEAEAKLKEALSHNPSDSIKANAQSFLAAALYRQGKYEEFRGALQQLEAGNPPPHLLYVPKYMEAESLYSDEDYGAARSLYLAYAKTFPKSEYAPMSRIGAASCLQVDGNYAEAIAEYEELLRDYPNHTVTERIYRHLAQCLLATGQVDRYRAMKVALLALDPHSPCIPALEYAEALQVLREGDVIDCQRRMEALAANYPRSIHRADYDYWTAATYVRQQNYAEAKQKFIAFCKAYPESDWRKDADYYVVFCSVDDSEAEYNARLNDFAARYPDSEQIAELKCRRAIGYFENGSEDGSSTEQTTPARKDAAMADIRAFLAATGNESTTSSAANGAAGGLASGPNRSLVRLPALFYAHQYEKLAKEAQIDLQTHPAHDRMWGELMFWRGVALALKNPPDFAAASRIFDEVIDADFIDVNMADHTHSKVIYWQIYIAHRQGDSEKAEIYRQKMATMPDNPLKRIILGK